MATKKKLLQAAAGSAGGAGGLNVENVFSTYLYEGNGSSQVIENGINLGQSYGSGGVKFDGVDDYMSVPASTDFEFGTGDFTVEAWVNTDYSDYFNIWQNSPVTGGAGTSNYFIGVGTDGSVEFSLHAGGGGFSTSAGAVSQGTWAHVAIVRNSGTTYIYVDGVQQTSSAFFSGYNFNVSSVHTIGYRVTPNYASGYMADLRVVKGTAVYTSNFTAPTSPLTAITNTVLLTCQGDGPFVDNSSSSHTVTVDGAKASTFGPFDAAEAGEGGLVWIKDRLTTRDHMLNDTERGADKSLSTNRTGTAFVNYGAVTSFNSNGFTLGAESAVNASGTDLTSWTFRKAPKFFTCVQYTGTGSSLTINHDLGVEPAVIIIKRTNTTGNWIVFTDVVDGTMDYLYLNDTSASADGSTLLSKSSTSFTLLQSFLYGNASGSEYVAYLFAHNDGDGDFGPTGDQDIIKCGSYTGTGSEMFIDLGFEPQWILTRRTDTTDNWFMVDTMRGIVSGGGEDYLWADTSNAEQATTAGWAVNPTGFTVESASRYASGGTYIYIAIRRGPMAVPTAATDVFSVELNSGTGAYSETTGWPVDLVIQNDRTGTYGIHRPYDRVRGGKYLETSTTGGEGTAAFGFDNSTGYSSSSSISAVDWVWRRAPSFCDVVAYTGTGSSQTVSHNLGVAPEMIWVKHRASSVNWNVYHKDLDATNPSHKYLMLDSADGVADNVNRWNDTEPTESVFSVGTSGGTNVSAGTYIAYLFATLDGVSKVGSYTGDGTNTNATNTQNIECGFAPRFVLVKASSTTGQWAVWDTERGIVAGDDPTLYLDSTSAEDTYDFIDPYATGFTITNLYGNYNQNGVDYIFYAIA